MNLIFRKVDSALEMTFLAICRNESVDATWKLKWLNINVVGLMRKDKIIPYADDVVLQEELFNLRKRKCV